MTYIYQRYKATYIYKRYCVRWITKPVNDEYRVDMREGREGRVRHVIDYYEVVDMEKARVHASDQVLHITKDEQEAWRYVDMLNKQAELENLTNVRTTGGV